MINHDAEIPSLIYATPLLKSIFLFEVGILIWRIVQWRRRRRVWGELVYRTRTHWLVTAWWGLFSLGCVVGAAYGTWTVAEAARFSLACLGWIPLGHRQLMVFGVSFLWVVTMFIIHGLCGCFMPLEIRQRGLCRNGLAFLSWNRISGVYWHHKGRLLAICLDGTMVIVEMVAKDSAAGVSEALQRFVPTLDEAPPQEGWWSRVRASVWMSRRKRFLLALFCVTLSANYVPLLADYRRESAVAERLAAAGAMVDVVGTYVESVSFGEDSRPTEEALQSLGRLRGLHWLSMRASMDDASMKHLPPIATLKDVILSRVPITDAALESLSPMTSLEELMLVKTRITGEGAEHLCGNRELRMLDIAEAPITRDGLRAISKLDQLTSLRFHNVPIEDDWLASLGDMPHLRSLYLSEVPLTDACVLTLASFKQLRNLSFCGMKITDESADVLKGMTHLKSLDLRETAVSVEVVEAIRKALPDTEVYPREPEAAGDWEPIGPRGDKVPADVDVLPPNGQLER